MTTSNQGFSFVPSTCKVETTDGPCGRKADGFGFGGGRCRFHDVIHSARYLDADLFAALTSELATLGPLSDDERHERSLKAALWRLEWTARDAARAQAAALEAGATPAEVDATIESGREQAKP